MCRTVYWKSPTCEHRWISIGQPCAKDPGFNKCNLFKTKRVLPFNVGGPISAANNTCPSCDMDGKYDGNMMRIVKSEYRGLRFAAKKENKLVFVDNRCTVM